MADVSRTVTLTGSAELVSLLEAVLAEAAYLGQVGMSRRVSFYVDGDGPDRLSLDPKLTAVGPADDATGDPYDYDTIAVTLTGVYGSEG